MSANDPYPALKGEMSYLRHAAEAGKPVLAVCLGAQLLARALGGTVAPTGGYQFGLRKLWISPEGHSDPAFGKITTPLAPTLHGESFTIPPEAMRLAEGFVMRRDGRYVRINMAFRFNNAYGVQFEPQLTLDEFKVWNRVFASDYRLMGPEFDAVEEAQRNEREFERFAPVHESQMGAFFRETACRFQPLIYHRLIALPGSAPVCRPRSTTTSPLTMTYSIPIGNCFGLVRVAGAFTERGSNTVTSAAMPSRSTPLSWSPSLCAGNEVILRMASGSDNCALL